MTTQGCQSERARGDESHADLLPKLCGHPSLGLHSGRSRGAAGCPREDSVNRKFSGILGNSSDTAPDGHGANFQPQEAAPRSSECPRQGLSSSQNTGVTAAGCALLAAAVLRWPTATPRRSSIHRAQLRRWIGSKPLTLSGVREPLLQGRRRWDHRCRCKALAV